MPTRPPSSTVLELFAGAGGLALGLHNAGLRPLGLIERDLDCVSTLRHNQPLWKVFHASVEDMDYSAFQGVDIVTGGFPCQAFSYSGQRKGFADQRGNLFFEMMRPIRELAPKLVLAENVQGLRSHNGGKTLAAIETAFRDAGYLVDSQLLNALDFGVPQKRKRLILIGIRKDLLPSTSLLSPSVRLRPPTNARQRTTIRDALTDCPPSPGMQFSPAKKKVMDLVPEGGCWVDLPPKVQKAYMGASYGHGSHMGGRRGMARRMAWNEPALTVLCSPSQKQTERCHPSESRPFTVRESARLQTFPDDWDFRGSLASQYRQIGNAVPVLLAEQLGQHLKTILENDTLGGR